MIKVKINLKLFNEVYRIEKQEPVYTYYDVTLLEEISDSEEYMFDIVNDYQRQDDCNLIDGYHTTYFIFEDISGIEILSTASDEELINKIKELNKVLILERAGLKESETIGYEEFIEALESIEVFDDIVLSETRYEFTKYDDKRIQEIADYLGVKFEE